VFEQMWQNCTDGPHKAEHIGLPETAVEVLAVPLIADLSTALPNAQFSVTVGSTDQLVDAMLKGSVDVALINPVPDDRVFYRPLIDEELMLVGGQTSGLEPDRPMTFAELVSRPIVVPRSSTGLGQILRNAALRAKVTIDYRTTTDSLPVVLALIEAGLAYGVLPLSGCHRGIAESRLHYTHIDEPALAQQLGVAATAQLNLPRELTVTLGNTLREQVSSLIRSGNWPAKLLATQPWNPKRN